MKLIDLPFFVELGAALERASSINPKGRLWDAYFDVFGLRRVLDTLLSGEHARLSATSHDLTQLRNAIDAFERRYFRDKDGNWSSPPEDQRDEFAISSLVTSIRQFRTVLIADLRTAAAFSVVGSGIFDVNLLVNCAHKAVPEKARAKLGADVLAELDASGKSLAFNLPTASGFHAMRAVERVIKLYLADYLATDEIEKLNNWGQYLSALEKRLGGEESPKPSQEAIALIRQIKDIYRNPVIHPERTLSPDEASTLFHSTLAAISRIADELRGEQKELPGLLGSIMGLPRSAGAAALLGQDAA